MCGITGFFNTSPGLSPQNDLLEATNSLAHRGPDASGTWSETNLVGLGHRRLSILDLSAQGNQPMYSADGELALVFNGEIYNFAAVKARLEQDGCKFRSNSDSEVILSSFKKWGKSCVDQFIGMFAFAIYEKSRKKLLLCRDRLGVKPLYYSWQNGCLCFASELRAITSFRHFKTEIDAGALGEFFQYGYISQPATIYRNASKLPPGFWLEISSEAPAPVLSKYWDINHILKQPVLEDSPECLEQRLESLLTDAFNYRMVSDVQVGVFLSGGLDSSLVTALLCRKAGQNVRTFTLGFNEKEVDESPWAEKIAGHLGTRHTKFMLSSKEAQNIISQLPEVYDEPFGDNSAIATIMLARQVSKEVKVVLSADGGDELFGGYDYYRSIPADFKRLNKIPGWFKNAAAKLLPGFSSPAAEMLENKLRLARLKKISRNLAQMSQICQNSSPGNFYRCMRACWQPPAIQNLLGDYSERRLSLDNLPETLSFSEKMMAWDLMYYIPDDILTKVDRATMSTGIEGRDPFLDHRIVELALRLPEKLKIADSTSKCVLRNILYKYVPAELIERPKQGFPIPLAQWRSETPGKLIAGEIEAFADSGKCGLNVRQIKSELAFYRHSSGNEFQIWLLYVFAGWAKRWLK